MGHRVRERKMGKTVVFFAEILDITQMLVRYNNPQVHTIPIFVPHNPTNKIFVPQIRQHRHIVPQILQHRHNLKKPLPTESVTITTKNQDAAKQTAHLNTCAGNASRNIPAKCAPSKTKQTSSFVNNPVNKNFLHFNKVKLNNYDTNVNDNNLSSNIIINDPDTRQNTDSLSGDFIIFRHGSPCESRSQTIVLDNHIQDEENLNNEQPFMN